MTTQFIYFLKSKTPFKPRCDISVFTKAAGRLTNRPETSDSKKVTRGFSLLQTARICQMDEYQGHVFTCKDFEQAGVEWMTVAALKAGADFMLRRLDLFSVVRLISHPVNRKGRRRNGAHLKAFPLRFQP